jgi:hypothetical protein
MEEFKQAAIQGNCFSGERKRKRENPPQIDLINIEKITRICKENLKDVFNTWGDEK